MDFILRKIAHVVVFGVLFVLLLWSFHGHRIPLRQRIVFAFVLVLFYAVFDEMHQSFIPTREGSLRDIVIDMIGPVVVLCLPQQIRCRFPFCSK